MATYDRSQLVRESQLVEREPPENCLPQTPVGRFFYYMMELIGFSSQKFYTRRFKPDYHERGSQDTSSQRRGRDSYQQQNKV